MSEVRPFPLDWESLSKGMWLEATDLERATRRPRDDKDFRLKTLAIAAEIRERTGILSRMEGDRLRLMTDVEAYQWNYEQSRLAVRKLTRSARRCVEIDKSQLGEADRRAAESCEIAIVATASAARREQTKHSKLYGLLAPDPAPQLEDGT